MRLQTACILLSSTGMARMLLGHTGRRDAPGGSRARAPPLAYPANPLDQAALGSLPAAAGLPCPGASLR